MTSSFHLVVWNKPDAQVRFCTLGRIVSPKGERACCRRESASLKSETDGYRNSRRRRHFLARTPAVRGDGLDTNRRSVRITEPRVERRLAVLAGRHPQSRDQPGGDGEPPNP